MADGEFKRLDRQFLLEENDELRELAGRLAEALRQIQDLLAEATSTMHWNEWGPAWPIYRLAEAVLAEWDAQRGQP